MKRNERTKKNKKSKNASTQKENKKINGGVDLELDENQTSDEIRAKGNEDSINLE